MNELEPVIGDWYLHRDKGETFRVVAIDEESGIIETQSFDGDVEELELDAWWDLDIEPAEPPEDWTGPYDDIEADDLDYSDTGMSGRDWREPLEPLRGPEETWAPEAAQEEDEEDIVPGELTAQLPDTLAEDLEDVPRDALPSDDSAALPRASDERPGKKPRGSGRKRPRNKRGSH